MKRSMWIGLLVVSAILVSGCASADMRDANPPSTETEQPCSPDWSCSEWGQCTATLTGGMQVRTCSHANNCSTVTGKPSESQACEPPRTTIREPSELALQLSDLPEGYQVVERGERLKSDVSRSGLNWGWRKGYHAVFLKQDKDNTLMYTAIDQSNSIYPSENITAVVDNDDWIANMTNVTVEELSDPKIGDKSWAWRMRAKTQASYTVYRIDFVKYDYYSTFLMSGTTGVDHELLKELARKVADRVV